MRKTIVRREFPATMKEKPQTIFIATIEPATEATIAANVNGFGFGLEGNTWPVVLRLGERLVFEVVDD